MKKNNQVPRAYRISPPHPCAPSRPPRGTPQGDWLSPAETDWGVWLTGGTANFATCFFGVMMVVDLVDLVDLVVAMWMVVVMLVGGGLGLVGGVGVIGFSFSFFATQITTQPPNDSERERQRERATATASPLSSPVITRHPTNQPHTPTVIWGSLGSRLTHQSHKHTRRVARN